MKKIVFSGIQPSGNLHIGNYIGAIKQWVGMQNYESGIMNYELIFCIVDLHAITVPQDPKVLREKILELAALYIACGIDPQKSHIFVQSENPDHTYLSWILNIHTKVGELMRMTQYKVKSGRVQMYSKALTELIRKGGNFPNPNDNTAVKNFFDSILHEYSEGETSNVGIFDYPVLMAADILLYGTNQVPVGKDQEQHIELARDIAESFNKQFGEVFKLPEPLIQKETARIMSLQNPTAKMSKSDKDPLGTINLLDDKDVIVEKVKKAVTDSGTEIVKQEDKPALSNLLTIYSSVSNMSIEELEKKYKGVGYAEFKKDLAEALVSFLSKIHNRYREIRQDENRLNQILDEGRDYAREKSSKKVKDVNEAVGLGR